MERAQGRASGNELGPRLNDLASEVIHAVGTDFHNHSCSSLEQIIPLDGESVELQTINLSDEVIRPSKLQSRCYPYTHHLTRLERCRPLSVSKSDIPLSAHRIVTPLIPQRWEEELRYHPDQEFRSYIVSGLANGFHIGYRYQGAARASASSNMMSAIRNPGPVQQYLATELAAGRIAGPFNAKEVENAQVSRFGVIPKGSKVGEWRLILDLSFPPGRSVNDGIDPQLCSLQYPTVDHAVERILQFPPGALLAKVDVAHAFRNIPVHTDDRHLLAMQWNGEVFIDLTLPFGLRSAPKIFTSVADALEWIMCSRGVSWSIHYIDDFLTVGKPDSEECNSNLETMLSTCEHLGMPLKAEKILGPTPALPFLGIVLDTQRQEIRLPEEKLVELKDLIKLWRQRKACKKRELLSLVGKLSHACKVVWVGRVFLRRMIDLSTKVRPLDHWLRLNSEFHADLAWWEAFLPLWNSRSMMGVHNPTWRPSVTFSTDASGSWGCGAVWKNEWLQHTWEEEWRHQSIAAKELVPIAAACAVWGPTWRGEHVLVQCDNLAVVHVINAQSGRDKTVMHLLRCVHFFCAVYDFRLRAEHLPGLLNVRADAISRNKMQVFFKEVPSARRSSNPLPPSVWAFLTRQRQDGRCPIWGELLSTAAGAPWQLALGGESSVDH